MTELRWHLFHIQLSQKRICLAREHTHNSLLYWLPYRWNSQPLCSYLINEMLWFVCWFMSVLNDYKSIKMFSIITWEMQRDWESLKFCDLVSILKVMQTHSFLFTVQNIEGFFLSLHVLGINQQPIFSPSSHNMVRTQSTPNQMTKHLFNIFHKADIQRIMH